MVADSIDAISDPCELEDELTPQSKLKRGKYPKLEKLVALQSDAERRVYNGATDRDAAALMRAWKELEILRRIMLNRPIQVLPVQARLPKMRKFGLVRSVDAQIVDVGPAEKPENAPSDATNSVDVGSVSGAIPASQTSQSVTPSK